ncbi:MAG TPA: HNH endonuclease [Candidatus Wunengus sp. YC61]|uniref:HNH endonuclease n=1 Tax=Candidatus Wunengus sp. YC61 TaxID=3367698 RepID=UPI0040282E8C
MSRRRNDFSRGQRNAMRKTLLNQTPYCFWCGKIFTEYNLFPPTREEVATIEHIIPLRIIGAWNFERNLRLACFSCNK